MNKEFVEKYSPYEIAELLGQPAPTPQQAAVIAAPLEPLLVVAGAGSGKTETMAARVVYLVANGLVRPEAVLGLTFTRKAAGELLERVQKRLGQLSSQLGLELDATNRPTVATYNSFAQSIVKENGLWVGIEPTAALLSEASAWQLMFRLISDHEGDLDTKSALSTITKHVLSLDGELTEHLVELEMFGDYVDEVIDKVAGLPFGPRKSSTPEELRKMLESLAVRKRYLDLITKFRNKKNELNSLTFGDQIAYAAQLATSVPAVAEAARGQYQVVLLDEYQDTSHAQVQFLAGLFGGGHAVTAVGDPNQAIYGWRGASASGLAKFPGEFQRTDGGNADVLPLATAWRNDQAILGVANLVAEPLREKSTRISVPELELSPTAGEGRVFSQVTRTVGDEAEVVADWIGQRWEAAREKLTARGGIDEKPLTAAVLCRTRKQFGPIAEALSARGIPYEIVGLGGLLDTPAVVDLIAILQAAADPSRGDWLVRLLTGPRVNLGAADLQALGSWAGDLARAGQPRGLAAGSSVISDDAEARSIIDALDHLPQPGQKARDGRGLTTEGLRRLGMLARSVRNIRRHSYLSLPEICLVAERELGLDIEVSVAGGSRGRAGLDAFRDVAANYARSMERPTLAGFLGWLATAEERERGLDLPLVEVNENAVQLITIHGAKGLEWDIVAVPGLVEGNFPSGNRSGAGRLHSAWLTNNGSLPYALRGDREDLPTIYWPDTTQAEVEALLKQLKVDSGEHELSSERRLAYVAFTRARHEMLLTGYWWGSQTRPREISLFLTELVEKGATSDAGWAAPPPEGEENPVLAVPKVAAWPVPESAYEQQVRQGATQVREALAGQPEVGSLEGNAVSAEIAELAETARILLREAEQQRPTEVTFPAQVSASTLVQIAEDRERFAEQLRRPIPRQPTVQAQVGTQFHEWVQGYYEGTGLLFEEDELYADADPDFEIDQATSAQAATLEGFKAAFEQSEWANLTPIAVEQEIHHTIAGVPVIARIDAVFADPQQPAQHIVVDWKTGKPGQTEADRTAREVQLAVYRLAWSRLSGKPVDQVSAAFHYVGANQTVRPAKLLTETELEQLIIGAA